MKTAAPRVALYARVSTPKQDPLNQIPVLTEYAEGRGYRVYNLYVDIASGCNPNRPQWQQLVNDAHRHKFDLVIAVRLDRVMRSLIHLINTIEDFKKYNIGIELIDLGRLDTETATGQLTVNVLASVAQWERTIISDRVKSALEEKRKQGIIGGRPKKSIDIDTAARLRLAGYSLRTIAEKMNCTASDLNNRRTLIKARMDEITLEQEKGGEE